MDKGGGRGCLIRKRGRGGGEGHGRSGLKRKPCCQERGNGLDTLRKKHVVGGSVVRQIAELAVPGSLSRYIPKGPRKAGLFTVEYCKKAEIL